MATLLFAMRRSIDTLRPVMTIVGHILVLCTALHAVHCGPTPAAPTSETTRLDIRGETVFKTGEVGTFTAVVTGRSGSIPASSVTWKSDHPEVFIIDSNGIGHAGRPGTATVTASDGERQALASVRVVPDVAGRWIGRAQNTVVRRISGQGPVDNPKGPSYYELRVDQIRDQLTATDWTLDFRERLTGTVTDTGLLSLSGTFEDPDGGHVDTSPWIAQLDGEHMTGRFIFVYRFTNFFGPQVIEYTFVILDLAKG